MTTRAKLFRTNRSQAVRLPKALAFPESVKEVEITRSGESLVVTPIKPTSSWEEYFKTGPFVTEDFLSERDQGTYDEREPL